MLIFPLLSDSLFDECRYAANNAAGQDNHQPVQPQRAFGQHRLHSKGGNPHDHTQNDRFSFTWTKHTIAHAHQHHDLDQANSSHNPVWVVRQLFVR